MLGCGGTSFPAATHPHCPKSRPPIEQSGLIVSDIEVLRIQYAETLRAWRNNFLANRKEVSQAV